MSVVVFRDGVMASDSGQWMGSIRSGTLRKVAKSTSGFIYGACGSSPAVWNFFAWVDGGEQGDAPKPVCENGEDSFFAMWYRSDKGLWMIDGTGAFPVTAPYFALGPSKGVALGALWAGASAADAVRATIEHSDDAFGAVQEVR